MKDNTNKKGTTDLIQDLNNLQILQTSSDWGEDIPEEIYETHFQNDCVEIDTGLDVDKHRWYETSIDVLEMADNKFLGVRYITDMFSESQGYSDCDYYLEFYEMEEISTVTYRRKK